MNPIFLILLSSAVIIGSSFLVSMIITKRSKVSVEDWAIGGRSLPIYVIVGTQYASVMGGGVLVAHVGIAYANGLSVITYGILMVLPFVGLIYLSNWLRSNNFTTIPEIFESLYGENKLMKLIAAIVTIIVPFGWVATQLVAFSSLYAQITGISPNLLIIGLGIVSLFFVMPAGLKTVAWTDFIFSCFMVIISITSIIFVFKIAGGPSNVIANVPDGFLDIPSSFGSVGLYTIFLWIFSTLPGGLTNQIYYQRICAINDPKLAKKSLAISALVALAGPLWACIMGISIRTAAPNLANPQMATGWFLTQVPTWFLAIFAGFVVAAIMSTISSAAQSVVVNITRDIYGSLISPGADKNKVLRLSRIITVLVMLTAVTLAIFFPSALGWLVATYAFSASALLLPIFLGYTFRNKKFFTPEGIIASMLSGIIFSFLGLTMKSLIPYVIWGILASLIAMVSVSMITKTKITKNAE